MKLEKVCWHWGEGTWNPQMALPYPEQKCCWECACSFSTWLESEKTEISQGTWVSQSFKPNFADSGVKSTELDKMVQFVFFFFFPSSKMNHLNSSIKHRNRIMSYSTAPRSLVSNNHKENHLIAFCEGGKWQLPPFLFIHTCLLTSWRQITLW